MVNESDFHLGNLCSITGPSNSTLAEKANTLFISKEILKAEISNIGPPYDMEFVEL